MRKTEFDGVSNEDFKSFQKLITDFYGLSWEQSYLQLTKEIESRLLRKDTNPRYRSHFEHSLKDLVITVVARFVRINAKLQAAGKKIDEFYAMLENRIGHVYKEELKKLIRAGKNLDIDDRNVPSETNSVYEKMEQEETRALRLRCQQHCFDKLPSHIANIFLEYYDTDGLSPKQRTYTRQQMAIRLASLPSFGITLEETTTAKKNLDSRISKLRRKHLKPCMKKCMQSPD